MKGGSTYKIYCLIDPRTETPFYVGATSNTLYFRLNGHLAATGNGIITKKRVQLIKDIRSAGVLPKIKLLEEVLLRSEANKRERFYFNEFKSKGYEMLQSDNAFFYSKTAKNIGRRKYASSKKQRRDPMRRSVFLDSQVYDKALRMAEERCIKVGDMVAELILDKAVAS